MSEKGGWPPRISLFQVVVAIVVVSALFIGYIFATLPPRGLAPSNTVQQGDSVKVDYIAYFEDGLVFDTSMEEVAKNDASYPKALSFELRDSYRPLEFDITESGGSVIRGFAEGVLGMREEETRVIEVPPEKGYGSPDPSLIEVRPLVVDMPLLEDLIVSDFQARFGRPPEEGLTLKDPFWKWNVTIISLSDDFVTIMNLPEQGLIIRPYETWQARVIEVDSSASDGLGVVVIRHLLGIGDIDRVKGEDSRGSFRVVDVDLEAGTYTVDYNREVVGTTLFFRVTLLTIVRF